MGLFSAIGSIAGAVLGGPLGGSIGGALGGALDGAQASSQASQYSAAQEAALAEQTRLYGLQADMGQYFFDQYQTNYAPLAQSQLQAAQVGLDPQYYANQADAGVMRNYSNALGSASRNLARAGVSPQDGQWQAMQRGAALDMASARVGAQNQARNQVMDTNWNRRNQMLDYGSGLVGSGTQLMGNAAQGMAGTASAYGQQAGAAGQAAGSAWNNTADAFVNWWNGGSNNPPGGQASGGFGGYSALPGFGQSSGSSSYGGGFGNYSAVPTGQNWFGG